MRLRDRLRSEDRLSRKYRGAHAYGGFKLTRDTIREEVTDGRLWVLGDQRKYDAGPNTPSLDGQRLDLFRWNPTATYDGWVRDTYKVYGKR